MTDLQLLKGMINSGVNNLYNHYPQIDKLNVFPVPDGDTGTNMNLTCTNGFAEIESQNFDNFSDLMAKFARGLIMGARGNSGVIFSQIMKGFSQGMKSAATLNVATWKACFEGAKTIAYEAVMKPVEGTILTVIRETHEFAENMPDDMEIKSFWTEIVKASNKSLENTPELLPALKEVGVVDSGGFGLVKFLEGMEYFLKNNKPIAKSKKLEENTGGNLEMDLEEGEFGYCTEAIVMLDQQWIEELKVNIIRNKFEEYGNSSIVAVKDEDILKVHTHALSPGQILTYLQQFGEFKTIKVENMTLQADHQVKGGNPNVNKKTTTSHTQIKKERTLENEVATIGVVPSKQMAEYFENELNVSYVINGGSKMNPSTNDFLKAIEAVDAKQVYIFPNDSNVLLAAKQAKDLEKKSKVTVIATKTIPQGMTAVLNFDPDEAAKKNEMNLNKAIKNVISFQISKAARDASIEGVKVKENQFMAIVDKKITFAGDTIVDVFNKALAKQITSKTEIITIFTGTEASVKEITELRKYLDENHDVEYEIVDGGQEVYSFIMGIE